MFNLFSRTCLSGALALLSLSTINSSLMACDCCPPSESGRLYIGGFGGGLYSDSSRLTQMGTAFFTEVQEGPLAVLAQGSSNKASSGFGGFQIGYERPFHIGYSDWTLGSAVEVEAYFYSRSIKGHLINPTDRLPEHDFADSFHANSGVCLINAVFSLKNSSFFGFSPYIGGGIGATRISLHHAESFQVSPEEPGINHFNSKTNDSSWAFAAQAKAGLKYDICESFHIFGEYRYLFVDSSNYIFGSTAYSGHVPTSPWNVKVKNIQYNAFAIGIQYDL